MACLAALTIAATLGIARADAVPVNYQPTPFVGWSTNGPVRAVLVVGDTVYAGGDFTTVTSPNGAQTLTRGGLAAWDMKTGAIRTGFVADTNGRVESLATDGNSLFVGGDYTQIKGRNVARVASLNLTTGNVNTGFSAGATSHVYALRVKGNRLYVGGAFSTLAGQPRARIGAVSTTTGALDPDFNPNADNAVHAIVVSPDGNTVYAGGDFLNIGGGARGWIAPLSSTTGALLPLTFQYPLVQTSVPYLIDLDISPSGDRIFAGLGGFENQAVSWSTVTGRRQWGRQVNGDLQAVKYINGNVYAGFHEGDLGDDTIRSLAIDANTGVAEPAWHIPMNSFYGVWDIDASQDGLVFGGEFTNVNGVGVTGVAIMPKAGTDTVAPTAPTNLRLTGSTANSVSFAWNAGTDNQGVTAYRVLRDGIEIGYTAGLSYTDPDLNAATDYKYEVQSVDASQNFSPSVGPIPAGTDQTLIAGGSAWRYLDNGTNQGTAWRANAFNDTAWAQGPAQLGYGDGDEATVVSFGPNPDSKYITTYFRRQITIANPAALSSVNLALMRDDGAVVYVNGTEVARSNMPTGTISSTTFATANVDGAAESQLFAFTVPTNVFVAGTNTIAVEVHQQYRGSSDLTMDLSLSTARSLASAPPVNLRTTSVTGTSAALAWDAPTGTITGYRVYRNGVLVGSPTGLTFSDPALTSATAYSYTVTAVNTTGIESQPTPALVVTTPDVVAPSVPTGLNASTISATRVVLDWNPSSDNVGVTAYDIYRDGNLIGSSPLATYTDTAVVPNAAYSYAVRARDAAGNASAQGTALPVSTPNTADLTPPTVPQNVRAVTTSTTWVDLAWDASTDAVGVTGYVVSRNGVDLPITAGTTFHDELLAPGVTYTYRVRALDAALNISDPSTALPVTTHTAIENPFGNGSVWKYTDDGVDRGTAWRATGFDDSTWKSGAAQLGYGDGDETTVMFNGGDVPDTRFMSHYLRKTISVPDASQVSLATLSVLRDDGVVVYVNGVEAFRDNMPAGAIAYNTFASTAVTDSAESTYYDFSIPPSMLVSGTNVIAVEIHNESRQGAGDLSFDARLQLSYGPLPVLAPINLRSTGSTGTTADLAWDAPAGTITGYKVFRDGVLVGSPSGTTFSDTGLTSAQTYAYTVKAIGPAPANVESPASNSVSVTTADTVAPSVPTGLASGPNTLTSVTLTWTASTDNVGTIGYDVLRDGALLGSSATASYLDSTAVGGTTYSYTVRAKDAAGNTSAESNSLSVTPPPPDTQPPSVPTNLRTTAATPTSVTLAWDASTDNDSGVAGYEILRDGSQIGTSATASYLDATALGGTTYSYTVRAKDAAGNTSAESDALSVTPPPPDTQPPSVPTNLRTTSLAPTSLTLAWDASTDNDSGVAGYDVLRNGLLIGSTAGLSLPDATVAPNTAYSYTVRAKDNKGNVSADSTAFVVTTPGDITAPVTTDNSATIGTAWRTTSATVTLSPTDNLSGVAQTYYTTDGSTPTTASANGTSVVLSTAGTYTIRYFSVDVAGNAEAVKTAGTVIRIDNVAPTLATTFPVNAAAYNTAGWNAGCATARICGTAADTLSGLTGVTMTIQRSSNNQFWNGSTWQAASSTRTATGTTSWFLSLPTSALTNGVTYTITTRATDAAGNQSAPLVQTFTYDTAGPASSTIASTNHNGAIDVGDTFTVTFGEALNPTTVAATGTLTLSRSNGNTSYGISGLTNGLVTTGGTGYLTSSGTTRTITYAGSLVLSNSNRTVTFTVTGACAGTCTARSTTAQQGQFQYSPATTLRDLAGNTATGTVTATRQVMF